VSNELQAQSVFLNGKCGIIVLKPEIQVRKYEICERTVTASLAVREGNNPTASHVTIISVYAPVQHEERRIFFEEDMPAAAEKVAIAGEPTIIMVDFNDYEFPALDRWPPPSKEDDYNRLNRQERRRIWAELLTRH
jgi:hypothetical protein